MPLFTYQAADPKGKRYSSSLEAHSLEQAKQKLRDQGILILSITQDSKGRSSKTSRSAFLIPFTMQLSQLVDAGIPLYDTLMILEEQYREEPSHEIFITLCEKIKSGSALSVAMEGFPDLFDMRYRSMIAAGEAAGALPSILDKLTFTLKKEDSLKQQIISSLLYPAILASFSSIVLIVLLVFVVPSMAEMFEGRELGILTTLVLGTSSLLRNYGWLILLLIGGGITTFLWKWRQPATRIWWDRFSLRIPFIRNLITKAALARFSRTLSTLQRGGLSLIDSLQIARGVMGQSALEDVMKQAEEQIIGGATLSSQLSASPLIPKLFSKMISIGEGAGNTTDMVEKVAQMYEEEVEKLLNRLVTLAQPLILVIMGVLIGIIMLAILLPLTDVSAFN